MYVCALQKFSRSCADSDSLPKLLSGNFPHRRYHCCCAAAASGRQAGPGRVFSRAIAAIFLRYTNTHCESCNHASCGHVVALPRPYECQRRVDCCFLLIAMDSSPAATVCIAAPEWFWFGLLLLLSFILPAAPSSHQRTCPSTIYYILQRLWLCDFLFSDFPTARIWSYLKLLTTDFLPNAVDARS